MTQYGTAAAVAGVWIRHLVASQPISATAATGTRTMTTSLLPATWGDTTWSLVLHSPQVGPTAITAKLEVEFVPGSGTFVDLSDRCASMEIVHPRAGADGRAAPTTLTAVIDNYPDATGFCPLTPGSPTAVRYPNVVRDRRVRGWATADTGSTWNRFNGWADTWIPDMNTGDPGSSTVTLTASCVLSRYARRQLISEYGEALTRLTLSDYWPYSEDSDATLVRGIAVDATVPDGIVVPPIGGGGSIAFQKPDAGILVDGSAEFARGDGSLTSASPVILHRLRAGQSIVRVSAWIKLAVDPAGANDDVLSLYRDDGTEVWRLLAANTAGTITWQLINGTGAVATSWNTGVPRDDSWHWVSILPFDSGGADAIALAVRDRSIPDRIVASAFFPVADPHFGEWLTVGGHMAPTRKGKQSNTLQGSVSSLHVQYGTDAPASWSALSAANVVITGVERAAHLFTTAASVDAIVGAGVGGSDADTTPVMLTNAPATLLDAWNEHAATVGGILSTLPDGRRRWAVPSVARPVAVALTLDASADLHMPAGGWVGLHDERPTRVTAASPAGSVTAIDTVTEAATGLRLEGPSLQLSAGRIDVARSRAAWVMAARGERLSSFGLDAALTAADKTGAIMALRPGDRIRVEGLPSSYMGLSYVDAYASGWRESYTDDRGVTFTFDTDPADDPPEAKFDDAEYARFGMDTTSTVTGGTCVGTTATGTVIITTTSPLTTTGGEFTLDLDWAGERITVSGVGGGTSPQTATVTARGVAPTVARVHATGDTVNLWHAATFAL
jgi:hypothetical protein